MRWVFECKIEDKRDCLILKINKEIVEYCDEFCVLFC